MITVLSILIWVVMILLLLCLIAGATLGVLALHDQISERLERRRAKRTSTPPPVFHHCAHCRRSHAGPEDCENWDAVW